MITAIKIDLGFKNQDEKFGLYITDISESDHEIEVYSTFLHPSLKRGWVGDMIYLTHKAYNLETYEPIEGESELMTTPNVLLRSVQQFMMHDDEPTEWKYVFLKD